MPEIVVRSPAERLKEMATQRRGAVALACFVLFLIALSLAIFMLNRPAAIAPPAEPAALPPVAPPPVVDANFASPPLTSGAAPGTILVHVDGAVKRPGLYSLPEGARVADAVEAAGGPRLPADLRAVNLAEALVDGQKLEIPKKGAEAVPAAPALPTTPVPSSTAPGSVTMVDLNTADAVALETLPEVGPVTAAAIIEYREQSGGFSSVDELLDVSGIGPATLEAMRPFVTV
jgi:competence protein ComEA